MMLVYGFAKYIVAYIIGVVPFILYGVDNGTIIRAAILMTAASIAEEFMYPPDGEEYGIENTISSIIVMIALLNIAIGWGAVLLKLNESGYLSGWLVP